MDLRIDPLPPESEPERRAWETYVAAHPDATLFHTLAWMDAVRAAYPHTPHYLMAWRGDRLAGVFPLFAVRSLLAGPIVVSIPYAVYGGVLCDEPAAGDALLQAARRYARRYQAAYIEIRSKVARWSDLPTVDRYASFCKPLPARVDDVLDGFPRKARAAVRRARDRDRLQVRFDGDQLPAVWALYSRSMRRLGSPNLPLRFFEALRAALPAAHVLSVVYHDGRPVAGLLSFIHRQTILPYYSGSAEPGAGPTGANNYLYATLMEHAVARGLQHFDFGRTRLDNHGSYHFKKNQGFQPTLLGYQFDVPRGRQVPNLTPANRKFHLAQRLWRHLPLALTRPLGGWLSASIPG